MAIGRGLSEGLDAGVWARHLRHVSAPPPREGVFDKGGAGIPRQAARLPFSYWFAL